MSVKFQDYYEILGIQRDATQDQVKKAFRKLARVHHPDVAKDKTGAEEKFKQINEAYEVLSDPEKRKRYDQLGEHWQTGGPPPDAGFGGWSQGDAGPEFEFGGTGFSDFFERYFSGAHQGFGGASGHRGGAKQRGRDIEADILISLEDALHGSERTLTLRRPAANGASVKTDTIEVRIPAGLREGQRIRLAGKGDPGIGGGPSGDIYLRIRFARHPDFNVEGQDLSYDLDLAPWEAVLGVEVKIPTLEGSSTLRVPPGTEAGTQLRLKGRGLPGKHGQRGDLHAIVHIQTPSTVSTEERELWKKLADISTFKPRHAP